MAGNDVKINPADIRATLPRFVAEADRLRMAADAFRSELVALGEPWGDDENGRKFGTTFAANQAVIVRSSDILAQGVASIAPTLEAMVGNTVGTDQANAQRLS
ncbi:WXG100 family type VII secretion target [Embleya sp. AB8]|uniref:WXG100 family type VII secretion target n=1 Tax=Embleya sp. AB8 TaxID=3156304 RepID=UPI003C772356